MPVASGDRFLPALAEGRVGVFDSWVFVDLAFDGDVAAPRVFFGAFDGDAAAARVFFGASDGECRADGFFRASSGFFLRSARSGDRPSELRFFFALLEDGVFFARPPALAASATRPPGPLEPSEAMGWDPALAALLCADVGVGVEAGRLRARAFFRVTRFLAPAIRHQSPMLHVSIMQAARRMLCRPPPRWRRGRIWTLTSERGDRQSMMDDGRDTDGHRHRRHEGRPPME